MKSLGHAFVLGLIATSMQLGDARADTWPIGRHDAGRTGASLGHVPTENPTITWRKYLGGRPYAKTLQFGMQNAATFVAAVGGRFILKNAMSQAEIWQSEMLGVGDVEALADLDGDNHPEVIVRTETRAHVLNGDTGVVLWSSAPESFGTPAVVRVVDLDGNGLPDVYIDECTTCAKKGTLSAGAYSFARGFGQPITLWERIAKSVPVPVNSASDAIVDLDEDGLPEVMLASSDRLTVVNGLNGATIATLSLPTSDQNPFPHARAIAAQIDGQPGKELVVIETTGQVATNTGPVGITVYKLDPRTGANSLLYRRVASTYDENMVAQADIVTDVDGNGISEVIFSHRGASNPRFVTEVLSGPTGTPIATFDGARFEGAANLDGTIGTEVILATENGLSIHRFRNGQFITAAGPIPDLRVQKMPDKKARQCGQFEFRAGVLERPGKRPALLVGKPTTQIPYGDLPEVNSFLDIRGLAFETSGLVTVGTHVPIEGEVSGLMPADGASRPYPQMAIGTSAGTVIVLSQSFEGTNGVVYAGGQATGSIVGGAMLPNTGAQSGPLIGHDADGPFVVLPGSSQGLFVGDARLASLIEPPVARWTAPRMGTPSVMNLGALGSVVVGVDGQTLVARNSSSGNVLGTVDLGIGAPRGTPLPLQLASSNVPLVGLDWQVDGVQIIQHGVDFASQTNVWQGKPLPYGGFFASGVADLDGDGNDEWYSMNGGLNRRNVQTGDADTRAGGGMGYTLPMAASFLPGGGTQLLLQGGGLAPTLVDASLNQVWQTPPVEAVNGMGGAWVRCGTGTRFVTPSVLSPMVRAFDGATGAFIAERALAGGAVYPSIAVAQAAGKTPGVLSNVSSVAQFGSGNGAVLAGSSDGYLYAVDACTLDFRWSKFLGGSVSEPIIGDTDGDQGDEIVVSVADGTIVNLDIPRFSSVKSVSFVGAKSADASITVAPGEHVTITFDSVLGATAYEYALIGPDDEALWSPAFRQASGTQARVDLAGTLASRPYRVAVRAQGSTGTSPETFSPNIVVQDQNLPTLDVQAKARENSLQLSLAMGDDLALDHWIVWMQDADQSDAPQIVAAEALVGGISAEVKAEIAAPSELWGKSVAIRVNVVDSANNAAQANFTAKIDDNGGILEVITTDPSGPLSFGGCRVSRNGTSNGGALAFLGIAVAFAWRARRRRN
ncbi:MAG TPA: VCBS repeat-containing protein [Polyangium sp.]|nr:VCBS repeat-containing protein [Polyangium sp.]